MKRSRKHTLLPVRTSSIRANRARNVVIALRMAGIAGQDKLAGVFRYLNEGHRWNAQIFRTRHEFTSESVRAAVAKGVEGFIVSIPGAEDALAALAETDLPVVVMDITPGPLEKRIHGIAYVNNNPTEIGRRAAGELLAQGIFRSYGYVGYRANDDWSIRRGRAFRDELLAHGFVGRMFDLDHYPDRFEDRAALMDWLNALPKPGGLFAACDDRAYEILELCRELNIRVPQEVAVLGVNNDPLLCDNAEPTLSSIQPDYQEEGYRAAELLDRLIGGHSMASMPLPSQVVCGVKAVVHRASTLPESPAGRLVQKAVAYITKNALKAISVADVARHLHVSRRLAELRFRELQHASIGETILDARLEEVKRRLILTTDTTERIAIDCGWTNPISLKNIFKRRFGVSMRTWSTRTTDTRSAIGAWSSRISP